MQPPTTPDRFFDLVDQAIFEVSDLLVGAEDAANGDNLAFMPLAKTSKAKRPAYNLFGSVKLVHLCDLA